MHWATDNSTFGGDEENSCRPLDISYFSFLTVLTFISLHNIPAVSSIRNILNIMAKRAVCVLVGDVKGTIYFDQEVSPQSSPEFEKLYFSGNSYSPPVLNSPC